MAIAADLDDDKAASAALTALGGVGSARGEHATAVTQAEEAVVLHERLGDPLLVLDAVYNLGLTAYHGGDLAHARSSTTLGQARGLGEAAFIAATLFAEIALVDGGTVSQPARETAAIYTELGDDQSQARWSGGPGGNRSGTGLLCGGGPHTRRRGRAW